MPTYRRPTGPAVAVLTLSCAALCFLPPPAATHGAGGSALPPLLEEPVVRALAEELSGTLARHTVQEISLEHRTRASMGFARAAETIRERAERYGLAEVEVIRLPADGEHFYGTQRSRPAWNVEQAELWEQERIAEGAEVGWADVRKIADWRTRPVTVAQDSASGEVSADLVDVGAGISAADYAGKEIEGRLVLTSSQPGAAASLALARGAVGIVSAAQNQRSAWWGEDRNLIRWGHMETFPAPATFGFMVTVNQALAWKERLARGERVRLRASVATRRTPGSYDIVTARIPGTDPDLRAQEVVYSCHLDHQRPGANDNASGCAAILEIARALQRLITAGKIPPPRRSLRFVWPPEIEGTIALLDARPDLAARARAVIHMDMVGGLEERTRSILHITRSPRSLPTAANDVVEAFARFVNEQSYAFAATGEADFPLVDPEGSRQALRSRIADFSMGSDHQVWTGGSFRVPAIYLNDWPDRYIHTHADGVQNVDPTKLLRAAFLGAASGYYLATVREEQVPDLLAVVRRHALERTAAALGRAAALAGDEADNLLRQHAAYERAVLGSVGSFAPWPVESVATIHALDEEVRRIAGVGSAEAVAEPQSAAGGEVCYRRREPKGPLWGFGYSWFEDRFSKTGLDRPGLLSFEGLWGSGAEYAYEVLNLADGRRTVHQVRDAVAATYGPVPLELVRGFLAALEAIDVVRCGAPLGLDDMMTASTAPLAERTPLFPPPAATRDLNFGGFTKVLCSALFVSGRDLDEAVENSASVFFGQPDPARNESIEVDRDREEVRIVRDGRVVRSARRFGGQGCVSLPPSGSAIRFEPVAVESALPDATTTPWPMGDRDAHLDPASVGIDPGALGAAVGLAFADPEALTQGVVVVHRGKIVAERYAPGHDPDMQLEGWSMGKSLAATLVGVLVEQGAIALDEPVPVPEWHVPGDPRSEIRVIDVLRMSSGLRFYSHHDSDWTPELGYLEHFYIYTGGIDVFDFSVSRPARVPPGTDGRYHNSDPLTLAGLVRQTVAARGGEPLTFPQRALFDRIGIRRQVLETDIAGNFVLSGYDFGTPRNWARLGMLYLDDGVFEGERILPAGWSELVSTPAPAWRAPVYGGSFWLNRDGSLDLPADAYFMAGAGSQYTIIVPSLDLVVVRMGHLRGGGPGRVALNRSLGAIRMLLEEAEAES